MSRSTNVRSETRPSADEPVTGGGPRSRVQLPRTGLRKSLIISGMNETTATVQTGLRDLAQSSDDLRSLADLVNNFAKQSATRTTDLETIETDLIKAVRA